MLGFTNIYLFIERSGWQHQAENAGLPNIYDPILISNFEFKPTISYFVL